MDDLIRRSEAIRIASGYCHWSNIPNELAKLPSVNPKPCEDAISRQAAIDAVVAGTQKDMEYNIKMIKQLPSVSTEKTGRWEFFEMIDKHYYCSECKSMGVDYWDYCPYCGAKMEVEE